MVEIVGHRAFAGKYPENTLEAFNKAYEAGVPILETDLQMTKDGIVIVNHDSTTGRMWNNDYIIANENFENLLNLQHKYLSQEKFMTIDDLLNWAIDHPNCKLMLDIKFDNDKILINKIHSSMLKLNNNINYWQKRIIWGVWSLDWYQYGITTALLKNFDIIVITMSLDVAEKFIKFSAELNDPDYALYGISLLYVSSWTKKFRDHLVPLIQKFNIHVFLWTVNKQIDMDYLIGLPIYGIITDDPITTTAYIQLLKDKIIAKKPFNIPQLTSREGIRFYSFCIIYDVIDQILHSGWAHTPILFGYSISKMTYTVLKAIHFM
ncbi:similar to Saccharomyces cerevisiae YPL206C PGC1 Phosphatidyl Glycerol phospholipase C [Maudiozyma saulgeensis]|uniref:Similar to Saccharomyces cerevisiae YPL206C PGC1 Phosphatidyl Glycerol phospholipase C n=1 Tax=Maudiozyma saulgeensis TaxID=1789683 RepID=A0A1X7R7C7_9SACH|nr:similar to Saccharomyces cerevisiae YPL206C PGC1 Phosphatidyl Glycerol phospholipase C [Kazachstania saulgeensis]